MCQENTKLSNWVSTQRQEYKLIQSGRQSRLSDDKIALLDDINFIWEAQRGGPRRQRKATVVVPSKPNPVDARKIKTKAATRGGKAGAAIRRGHVSAPRSDELATTKVEASPENGQVKNNRESSHLDQLPVQQSQAFALNSANLTGMNATGTGVSSLMPGAYIPALMQSSGLSGVCAPGLQLASYPWQVLNNGIFQSSIAQSAGLTSSQLFPLASRLQLAQPGFQFGNSHNMYMDPSRQLHQAALGQLSSFQFGSSHVDPSRQMQQAALSQFSSLQHHPQASALLFTPSGAFLGSADIPNLQQHLQLPHSYLLGDIAREQAQDPKQNER